MHRKDEKGTRNPRLGEREHHWVYKVLEKNSFFKQNHTARQRYF
jgi:hypothetical protein